MFLLEMVFISCISHDGMSIFCPNPNLSPTPLPHSLGGKKNKNKINLESIAFRSCNKTSIRTVYIDGVLATGISHVCIKEKGHL